MKKSAIVVMMVILMTTLEVVGLTPYKYYQKLVKKQQIGVIREYWTTDLTEKILQNRGDTLIIEKCIGRCTSRKKDGVILGVDAPYNRISYRNVKGIRKGDVVLTVYIWNPLSDKKKREDFDESDIGYRCDFIIDKQRN